MAERISSLDAGYMSGDLSLFPDVVDDKDSLYEVRNNAETKLRSGLPYNGKKIIVESTSTFPNKGLLRVGPAAGQSGDAELIYYDSKTETTFKDLVRGFSGSKQNQWPSGSWATNAVTAEPHNAVKDALLNVEKRIGLRNFPDSGTMHRRIKDLELKFLSPKAVFRAFPKKVRPSLPVRFQNFSEGDIVRYLWDFGDGGQSVEENPTYTYLNEGTYSVKLHLITSTGAQGISTKTNYITVSADERLAFFYTKKISSLKYKFVDQTDGEIKQRFWVFGGKGTVEGQAGLVDKYVETNPNKHEITFTYEKAGTYIPSLLVGFASDSVKRIFLSEQALEAI
jgi:PKD repeat protein